MLWRTAGLGLGAILSGVKTISDECFLVSARSLSEQATADDLKAGCLNVLDPVFAAAAAGGLPNLQPWPGGALGLGLACHGRKTQQRAGVGQQMSTVHGVILKVLGCLLR